MVFFVFVSISVLDLLADPYTVVARLSQLFLFVFWCKRLIFHPLGIYTLARVVGEIFQFTSQLGREFQSESGF